MIPNDEVAGFVFECPDCLVGIGAVDVARPMQAVAEVRRYVEELGFRVIRVLAAGAAAHGPPALSGLSRLLRPRRTVPHPDRPYR